MNRVLRSAVFLAVFLVAVSTELRADTSVLELCQAEEDSLEFDTYSGATKDLDSPVEPENDQPIKDSWVSTDKFMHFGVCAAIPGLTYYAYVYRLNQDKAQARIIAVSLTGLVGLGKEIYDKKTKGHFSWKDLVWDGLGLTAGYFLFIHDFGR